MRIGIMKHPLSESTDRLFKDNFNVVVLPIKKRYKIRIFNLISNIYFFTKKLKYVDVIYFFYIHKNYWLYAKIANINNKKVIYHWLGTDVYNFTINKFKISRFNSKVNLHLAYSESLSQELKMLGVDSKVLMLPSTLDDGISSMPENHGVLLSIPDEDMEIAEFYGYSFMVDLINFFPNITFYVIRASNKDLFNYKNVQFIGNVEPEKISKLFDKVSIVLRKTTHDGTSLIIVESLLKGKQIIYNHQFPYTFYATNFTEYKEIIQKIVSETPKVNYSGRKFAKENYSFEVAREKFYNYTSELYKDNRNV